MIWLYTVLVAVVLIGHTVKWLDGRESGLNVTAWFAVYALCVGPRLVTYFRRRARRARLLLERVSRGPE